MKLRALVVLERTQQFLRFTHAGFENWSYMLLPALKLECIVERS